MLYPFRKFNDLFFFSVLRMSFRLNQLRDSAPDSDATSTTATLLAEQARPRDHSRTRGRC